MDERKRIARCDIDNIRDFFQVLDYLTGNKRYRIIKVNNLFT